MYLLITLFLVDIEDYHDIYDKVKSLSARWKPIALSLRLRIDTINTIETNCRGLALSCLQQVLECWLRKDYNYNGVPCWRTMCVAVKEGGGDPALADEIAREHPLPDTGEIRASSEQAMSPTTTTSSTGIMNMNDQSCTCT